MVLPIEPKSKSEMTAVGTVLFQRPWVSGSMNDILRTYLQEQGLVFYNTFNGDVFFFKENRWHAVDFDVNDGVVTAYDLVKFQ